MEHGRKTLGNRGDRSIAVTQGSDLGEAAVVLAHHGGVGTVQLLDDLKALVELREDVHHRAGEESVLRRRLELQTPICSHLMAGFSVLSIRQT